MIFRIEDYKGSIEMLIGGEDYIRFKNYLQVGQFLHIKGKVQSRWSQQDQFEFKILHIQLLTEIREKLCKKIKISLTLDLIDEKTVMILNETFTANPGGCSVNMVVTDPESNAQVEMLSRGFRVAPSNELFKVLGLMEGVKFALN